MDISGVYYCSKCMLQMEEDGACPHCGYDPDKKEIIRKHLEEGCFLNDRYLLGSVIGSGGFGITYAAWDTLLDMPVAIKEYFPRDFADRDVRDGDEVLVREKHETEYKLGLRRFIQESRVLAMFSQIPGIVNVSDCFEENETFYFVMEYVRGVPLDVYAQEHKLDAKQLLGMMRGVIDALEAVHAQGVLHRDITPKNLMVLEDGSVKLIDFGAARKMDREGSVVIVTEHYAPVEQYDNTREQGPWIDIYSLCATMYEMLTAVVPQESLARKHRDELKAPSALNVHLKKYQERALMAGLAVEPEKRIRSIAELRSMLYNLPLPEEIRRRKAFMRKVGIICAAFLVVCTTFIINFTTGLPMHRGLMLSLRLDGWHVVGLSSQPIELSLPESCLSIPVTQIAESVFKGNDTLAVLEVPSSIKEIGSSAFFNCPELYSVRLNEGTKHIADYAFAECPKLYEAFLPASLETIDETAFSGANPRLYLWGTHETSAAEFADKMDLPFASREDFTTKELEDGSICITEFDADNNPNLWSELTNESDSSEYFGTIPKLVFPDYIDGKLVTEMEYLEPEVYIDGWAVDRTKPLGTSIKESIVYPKGLSRLGYCFPVDYTKHIDIGDAVVTIGGMAFSHSRIEEITLPDSVLEIDYMAFRDTVNLQKIDLPSKLNLIGSEAFYGSGIRSIKIPDTVTDLGGSVFSFSKLESVYLGDGITEIDLSTFSNCENLTDIYIPEGIEQIDIHAFADCTNLEYLALPEGLTTIKADAFKNCYRLRSIYIPASTVDIDDEAFWGCSRDLVIMGHVGSYAEDYAQKMGMKFENVDLWPEVISSEITDFSASVVIHYPDEDDLTAMGRSRDEIILPSYYMGRPVTEIIAENGFEMRFSKIILPLYLENLSSEASIDLGISNCDLIEELLIRSDIPAIEENVLEGCENLKKFVLPNSVKEIGSYAFRYCTSLEEVIIPEGVTCIEKNAFDGCASLKSVSLPNSLLEIGREAFVGCTALEEMTIPTSVCSIGRGCFRRSGLQKISLPPTPFCDTFFQDCKHLEYITLEEGYYEVECGFEFCPQLKEVVLPATLADINECTFLGCESLTDVWFYSKDFSLWRCGDAIKAHSSTTLLEEEQEIRPEYIFSDSPNVTIHGYINSKAHEIARYCGLNFEPIPEGE